MTAVITAIIGSAIIGYGLGCINLSYILGKLKGFDIRKYGSGNAGASNVMIVMGRKTGLAIALVDVIKAYIAVKLAASCFAGATLGGVNYAACIAGSMSIIGHIFPFYMGFKGGKGLATLGGTILALDYKMFFVLLLIALVIAVVTDYICFVPMTMALIFPLTYGYIYRSWVCAAILLLAGLFIEFKHIKNIERIKSGEELRFHFLWNRKSEADRFGIADNGEEIFEANLDKENDTVIADEVQGMSH